MTDENVTKITAGGRKQRGVDAAAILERVEEINRNHALVLEGGRAVVVRNVVGPEGRPEISFLTVQGFKHWFANEEFYVGGGDTLPLGEIWMSHPARKQFKGVVFAPDGAAEEFLNLWRGFAYEPSLEGSCALFRQHLMDNVCAGDVRLFDWVWGWFAQMVQQPGTKVGTSLVLRGHQGCGKTIVGWIVGQLFGDHYALVDDPRYITGNFNAHLRQCILLQADEGFWAGDRAAEGRLKGLVTAEYQMIEPKNVDPFRARNCVRLLITSNADWVVPAAFEERRFAVLDVGDDWKQDRARFGAMLEELERGGYGRLLHELLEFDLSEVDVGRIPSTEALFDQKVASMDPLMAWWYERLVKGTLLDEHDVWQTQVAGVDLVKSQARVADHLGARRKALETTIGIALRKRLCRPGTVTKTKVYVDVVDAHGNKDRKRVSGYKIPGLADCRAYFSEIVGYDVTWEDG